MSDLAIAYKNYLRNDLGLKKSGVDAILEATSADLDAYTLRGGKKESAKKEADMARYEEAKAREKEHEEAQKRAEDMRKQQERIDAAKEEGRRQGLAEAKALAEAAQKSAAEQSAPVEEEATPAPVEEKATPAPVEEEATPAPVEEPAPAEVTPTEEGQEDVSVLNEGTGPAPERTEEAREAAVEGERRLPQGTRHSIRDYTQRADLIDDGDYILEIDDIHGDQTSPEGIARHRVASVLEKIAPLFGVKEIHWVLTGDQYGFPLKDGGHAGAFFEPRTQAIVVPIDSVLSHGVYSINHISFGLHELFHALVKETDSAILTYLTKTLPKENANYKSLLDSAAAQDRYDPYRKAGDDEYEEVLADVFGAVDEEYLYPLHQYVINAVRKFVPNFDIDEYYNTLSEMREMFPLTTRTELEKEAAKLPGADILAQARKAEEEQRKSLTEQAKQTVKEVEQVLSLLSKPIVESAPTNAVEPLEDQPLENLGLPTRVRNTLNKAGINTIGDLLGMTEDGLADIPGVGPQTLKAVTEALSKRGHALRVETEATVETAENLSSQAEPTEKVEVTVTDGRKKSVSLPQFIQRLITGKQQAAEISTQERYKQQRAEYGARVQELKDMAARVLKSAVPTSEAVEAARAEAYNRAIELSQRIRALENQLAELSDTATSARVEEIEERINELQNKKRLTKKEAEELLDLNDEYYELTEEGQLVFDEAAADRMEPILRQIDTLEQELDRLSDEITGLALLAVQAKEAETGLSKKEAADAVETKLRAINDRLDQMFISLSSESPEFQFVSTAYRNLTSIESELAELPLDTEPAQQLRREIDTAISALRSMFANRWAKTVGLFDEKGIGTIERIARVRDWFSLVKQSQGRQGSSYILKLKKEIRAAANELVRDNTISEARKEELKNEIRKMYADLATIDSYVRSQEEKRRGKITYNVNGKQVSEQEWARLSGVENWKDPVYGFTGRKYGYLSTFGSYPFEFDGLRYHSAEAAYQAQKTLDPELRKQFADKRDNRGKYIGVTPEEAKRLGAALDLRPDWENVKLSVMFDIQKAKFEQNPYLRNDLVKTEHRDLLHLNKHNDRFWGVVEEGVRGEYTGENYLGQILMQLRSEFIAEDAAKAVTAKAGQEADRIVTGEDKDAEAEAQAIREKYKTGEFEEGDQAGHDEAGRTTTGRLRWGSSSFDTNEDVFAATDAIESMGNARNIAVLTRGEAPTQLPPIKNMRAVLDGFIKLWKSPFVLNTYHLYNDAVNKARIAELALRNTRKNNIVGLIDLIEADINADAEKIAKTKENSQNFYEHLQGYVRQAMGDYANDTRLMKAAVEFALGQAKAEDLRNKIESRLSRLLHDYSDPVRPQDPAWNDIYDTLARGVALGCITPAAAKQALLNAQRKSGGAPITSGQVLLDAQKLTDLTIDSFTHKRHTYDAATGEGALSWDRASRPSAVDQAKAAERRARYENRIPGVDARTEEALLHSSFYSEPDPETGITKNQQLQELTRRYKEVQIAIQERMNSLRQLIRTFAERGIFNGTAAEQAAQEFLESEATPFTTDPFTGEVLTVSDKAIAEIEQSVSAILEQLNGDTELHERAAELGDVYNELRRQARDIIGTNRARGNNPDTLSALRTERQYLDEQIGELLQQAALANNILQDAQLQTYLMENGLSAEDIADFAVESAVEGIAEPDPHLVGQYRNINNKGALGMSADEYGRPTGELIYDYGMADETNVSPGEDMQSMDDLGYREYNADWYEFDTGATDDRGNKIFQYINKDTGEVRDTPPDQTKLFIRSDDPRMRAVEHLIKHGEKEESFTDHFDKTFDEAREDEWRNASAGNLTPNGISRVLNMRAQTKEYYDSLPDYLRPAGINKWNEDGTPFLERDDTKEDVDVDELIAQNRALREKRSILPPKSISATDKIEYEKQDLSTITSSTWDKLRQTLFNAAHALDKASKKQTSAVTFKEELKKARNSTSFASAILDTGLLDNQYNLVGESYADVFLEYDIDPDNPKRKKYNAERQKTKEYAMLLMHHIDRMNAPKRLQRRVATMLVQQPWLADLTDEQLTAMAAKGDPIVSEFAEAVSMMNDALDSKEKPVLAGDLENPLEPMPVEEAKRQLREIISENPWVVDRCKAFYLWYDTFYRNWALGDSLTEHRYELMHEIYPHYVPTNRADRTQVDEAREALDAFVIQYPEYKGPHTSEVMLKAYNAAKKGDEIAAKFIQLRNALESADYTVPAQRVLGGGGGGGISAVHGSVSAGTVTHASTGSLRTVRPLADQIADEIVRITKLKLWTELTRMINAEAMMDRNHEIFNGELSWDAAYTAKADKKAYAQMFEETENDVLAKDSGQYFVNSWMNGQRVRTQVNQQIYQGLDILLDKNSDAGWSAIVRDAMVIGRRLNNASKNFITAISPTFAIRNPIRDLWSAITYTENGVGLFLKNYFTQSWRQMAANSENWQDFVNMGGKQSTLVQSLLERKVTDKRSRKRTFQQAVDGDPWYKHPWQSLIVNPLATIGEFTESMTRFAEYLATIDDHNKKTAPLDPLTKKIIGIQRSAEVTVDFGRYGAAGMFGNAFVRYFNANMQGLSKTFRTVTDQPDVKSKLQRIGRVAAVSILPRIIMAAVIRAMGRWDEYEKLSEYVRASSLVFPIDKEGRNWVRIPFSRDWGVILGVPAQDLLRGVWDDEDGVLSAIDVQRYWKTAFAPNVLPPGPKDALVFGQALNLAENEDFKGSAIVPRDMVNRSKHLQYDKDTSIASYYLAQGLYELGDAIGMEIELSPAQMDYLIENFFGDFWSQAIPLFWPYGLISKDESGNPEYTFKDSTMAVIKDTLVDTWVSDSWRSNTITSRYYEMLSDLSTAVQDQGAFGGSSTGTIEDQIQKALTNDNGLQQRISKVVAQIRELPDGPEKDALYQLRNSMMEDALNFYRMCIEGDIADPQMYMLYRDYGQKLMNEAKRLDEYSDDYDFAPDFSRPSYITDPDKKGYRYDLVGKTKEETEALKDLYVQYCQQEYSQAVSFTMANSEYKGADKVTQAILLSKAKDTAIAEAKQDMAEYLTAHGFTSRQSTDTEHEEEEREAKYMYQRIIGEANLSKPVTDTILRLYDYTEDYSFAPPTYVPGSYTDPNNKQYSYVLTDNDAARNEYKRLRDAVYNAVFERVIDGPDFWQLDDEYQAQYLAAARSVCTELTRKYFLEWAAENMEHVPKVTEESEHEEKVNDYFKELTKDLLRSQGVTF